jgi:hypothetical protein
MSEEINSTLKKTILNSELPAVIYQAGEIGFDSLLNEGVLKEVPVLSTILAIGNTYGNMRDYFLAKKLIQFLKEISTLNSDERIQLIDKLESDDKYAAGMGERIINLLSRLDDENKPLLIAKAFKLYAAGYLNYIQLQRVNCAIERLLFCDLGELSALLNDEDEIKIPSNDPLMVNYMNSGLAYAATGYDLGIIRPTETAKLLIKVIDS